MLAGGGIRGAPAGPGESLRLLFGLTKARSSVRKYGPGTVLSLTLAERPKSGSTGFRRSAVREDSECDASLMVLLPKIPVRRLLSRLLQSMSVSQTPAAPKVHATPPNLHGSTSLDRSAFSQTLRIKAVKTPPKLCSTFVETNFEYVQSASHPATVIA
jgi:hypothetical protein